MKDYHKYPEVPIWFRPHLNKLRETWGTHLLEVTREIEDDEGEKCTETIFIRYVPWDFTDFLEYIIEGEPYWYRGGIFHLIDKESSVKLVKGKHDRIREEWGEEFMVKLRGLN